MRLFVKACRCYQDLWLLSAVCQRFSEAARGEVYVRASLSIDQVCSITIDYTGLDSRLVHIAGSSANPIGQAPNRPLFFNWTTTTAQAKNARTLSAVIVWLCRDIRDCVDDDEVMHFTAILSRLGVFSWAAYCTHGDTGGSVRVVRDSCD